MYSLSIFYLAPLQFTWSKYGRQEFLLSSVISLCTGLLLSVFRGIGQEILIPLGLLAGLAALNMLQFNEGWKRLIIASLFCTLGTILVLGITGRDTLITGIISALEGSPEIEELFAAIVPRQGLEQQINFIFDLALRAIVLSSTLSLILGYGLGRALGSGVSSLLRIRLNFPEWFIWVFIVSAIVLMAGEILTIIPLSYIGWNCFLFAALLYFLKGFGILAGLLGKKPFIPALLILAILVPGVNAIFILGLVILGIASIWIPQLNKNTHEEKI